MVVLRQGRPWCGAAVLGLWVLLTNGSALEARPGPSEEPPEASSWVERDGEAAEVEGAAEAAETPPASMPRVASRQPAAPVDPGAPSTANAGYDEGFYIRSEDGRFVLKTQARLQVLYQLDCVDLGVDRCQENLSLPRAQLTFSGTAVSRALRYSFQAEFGKGFVYLKDSYLDAGLVPGSLFLRVGQFKRPFSRQQITSDGKLETVDRSLLDRFSDSGRDIGLMLHDDYDRSPTVEWALGIFNGSGVVPRLQQSADRDPKTGKATVSQSALTNIPGRFLPAFVLRLGLNQRGIAGYSEADLEGGPLRFGVGTSSLLELDADRNERAATRTELDYVLKAHGFSSTGGLYLQATRPGNGMKNMDFSGWGFFAQAGYLLQGRYEPTLRYARLVPDRKGARQVEYTLGLSVFLSKHDLKWQTEVALGNLVEPDEQKNEYVLRSQVQLGF